MSNEMDTISIVDGFDASPNESGRGIIRGAKAKFDGGNWIMSDGSAIPNELIVADVATVDQHWEKGLPIETVLHEPGVEYTHPDELNKNFPKDTWEVTEFGPKPPWSRQYVVYLLDPVDGSTYTSLNSTAGQKFAVQNLKDKVRVTRKLHGSRVVPVVALGSASMKTRFGVKQRPEFEIIRWISQGGEPALMIEKPVASLTASEIIGDSIPDHPLPTKSSKGKASKAAKPDFDDALPAF